MKTPKSKIHWFNLAALGAVLQLLLSVTASHAATFTVTTTNVAGPGSLRTAIVAANVASGLDTIAFNIGGGGAQTIRPQSSLPTLTDPVILDATTQLGFSGTPLIELDGSEAGPGTVGLTIAGGGSTVRGLVINRFGGDGLVLTSQGTNIVAGNFIGTDRSGTNAAGNGSSASEGRGVYIHSSSPGNMIGGTTTATRNLISGNPLGIVIDSSDGNQVLGNFIGPDVTGTKAIAITNTTGVLIYISEGNHIGAPGAGNLISGNASDPAGPWYMGTGVVLASGGNVIIEGNLIGTDVTGKVSLGNRVGLSVGNGCRIGGTAAGAGNVISGNSYMGMTLGGTGSTVQGNFIGTDRDGMIPLGNGETGVRSYASGCLIGGTVPEARNVISGNGSNSYGVLICCQGTDNNVVQGNFIGTDVTGTRALGEQGTGLAIFGGATNLIGGVIPGARNVISGNLGTALDMGGNGNKVQGNFIGTDVTGTVALGNGTGIGIYVRSDSTNNLIGGSAPGAGNLISGNNAQAAIFLAGPAVTGTLIQGNLIGTDATGTSPLGNLQSVGIWINGSSGNTIGGTLPGQGNVIAFHIWNGVTVENPPPYTDFGLRNAILGNSIFDNNQMGIDLGVDGRTSNDPLDGDTGPNNRQNFPVIQSAITLSGHTTVAGLLDSTPNTTFRVEFFANTSLDASGYAEGETFVGWTEVPTDDTGYATFAFALPIAVGPGNVITATATDPNGNTSEFSAKSPPVNSPPVLPVPTNRTINELTPLVVTNTATDPDIPANTLTYSLLTGPPGAQINASGVISWTPTEAQGPSTNTITTKVVDNGVTPLSATNSFTVVVNEVNSPPVLPVQTNRTINELSALVVTNAATDSDIPVNSLTYALLNPPGGATIDANGIITWTPGEAQGPSTNVFTTVATDTNSVAVNANSLSVTSSFQVVVNEVNTAPVLTVPGTQTLDELTALTVTNTATDVDLPTNTLTFSLLSAPTGMVLNAASGVITWTPGEAQGPGTNLVVVKVQDNGSPVLSATNTFTVIVNEVNRVPLLPSQTNRAIGELTTLTVTNTAADADLPANALTYSLLAAPGTASLSPGGVITWTPTEADGPSTNTFTTRVTDAGSPSLSATNTFTVVVNEVNTAPQLTVPGNQTIAELTPLNVAASATDSDQPANTLTFALISPPSGMTINTNTGAISWTPTEAQGPSTNVILVSVTDTNPIAVNATSLSVTSSFQIVVGEVNTAPVLGALSNYNVNAGQTINFTATATDADVPANLLSFSLLSPPAGATITSGGLFNWRPGVALANTTNALQVMVQDNGAPVLNDTRSFTVVVNPLAALVVLTPISYSNGQFTLGVTGPLDLDYVVMGSTNLQQWSDLVTNPSPILPFQHTDTNAGSFSNRAYRVRLEP